MTDVTIKTPLKDDNAKTHKILDVSGCKGKVKGKEKGTAKAWYGFRLVCMALLPLSIWFVVFMVQHVGHPYAVWIGALQKTHNNLLMMLTTGVVCHHAAHGLHEIIEDYVKPACVKRLLMLSASLGLTMIALGSGYALLKIYLG